MCQWWTNRSWTTQTHRFCFRITIRCQVFSCADCIDAVVCYICRWKETRKKNAIDEQKLNFDWNWTVNPVLTTVSVYFHCRWYELLLKNLLDEWSKRIYLRLCNCCAKNCHMCLLAAANNGQVPDCNVRFVQCPAKETREKWKKRNNKLVDFWI